MEQKLMNEKLIFAVCVSTPPFDVTNRLDVAKLRLTLFFLLIGSLKVLRYIHIKCPKNAKKHQISRWRFSWLMKKDELSFCITTGHGLPTIFPPSGIFRILYLKRSKNHKMAADGQPTQHCPMATRS